MKISLSSCGVLCSIFHFWTLFSLYFCNSFLPTNSDTLDIALNSNPPYFWMPSIPGIPHLMQKETNLSQAYGTYCVRDIEPVCVRHVQCIWNMLQLLHIPKRAHWAHCTWGAPEWPLMWCRTHLHTNRKPGVAGPNVPRLICSHGQ